MTNINPYRYLVIHWKTNKEKDQIQKILQQSRHQKAFLDRKLKTRFKKIPSNQTHEIQLIGYDGGIKYTAPKLTEYQLTKIYRLIDQMPMGRQEATKRKLTIRKKIKSKTKSRRKSKTKPKTKSRTKSRSKSKRKSRSKSKRKTKSKKKPNMELYSDRHPETTLHGTGFKDAAKAIYTIELVKNRHLIYQFQVINTMYYRAKHHPHRTKNMEEAMKIFKVWLDQYPAKKNQK